MVGAHDADRNQFDTNLCADAKVNFTRGEYDQLCVNVGKKVVRTIDPKEQSLQGAQWVPAYLLEILPDQPMTVQMSSNHTTAMIKYALRYPAANAFLIESEGLEKLGIRLHQGQPGTLPVFMSHIVSKRV